MDGESLKAFILLFCGFLGLLWSAFLLTHKQGKRHANRFLAILVFILALKLLTRGSYSESIRSYFILLLFLSNGLAYWIGPSLLMHVKTMAGQQVDRTALIRHFSLGIIIMMCSVVGFALRDSLELLEISQTLRFALIGFIASQIIHLIVYVVLARSEVSTFEQRILQTHSSKEKVSLNWVKQLTLVTYLFALLVLGMNILIITGGYYKLDNNADFLYLLMIGLIVFTIVLKSWRRPEVYSQSHEPLEKYRNTPIPEETKSTVLKNLEKLIEADRVYSMPELKLADLAKQLSIQPHVLSQILNTEYGKSFFNYINDLRIEEAEVKLKSGYLEKETIAGLAYYVGFNSKSTFNRAFKKKTGMTPTEFIRSQA